MINGDEGKEKKKRGRGKNGSARYEVNRGQSKFFVDLSNEDKELEVVFDLLTKANKKTYGHPISFKDLSIFAIRKLNAKDIEKIQEQSLSEMEKVGRMLVEYNQKNNTTLGLGEFLVKKLNIN